MRNSNRPLPTPDRPNFYGRRGSRPLKDSRRALVDELLPKIGITYPDQADVDPNGYFAEKPEQLWLEIGFGGGEHLAGQAQANPQTGIIGAEPFMDGVGSMFGSLRTIPDHCFISWLMPALIGHSCCSRIRGRKSVMLNVDSLAPKTLHCWRVFSKMGPSSGWPATICSIFPGHCNICTIIRISNGLLKAPKTGAIRPLIGSNPVMNKKHSVRAKSATICGFVVKSVPDLHGFLLLSDPHQRLFVVCGFSFA